MKNYRMFATLAIIAAAGAAAMIVAASMDAESIPLPRPKPHELTNSIPPVDANGNSVSKLPLCLMPKPFCNI